LLFFLLNHPEKDVLPVSKMGKLRLRAVNCFCQGDGESQWLVPALKSLVPSGAARWGGQWADRMGEARCSAGGDQGGGAPGMVQSRAGGRQAAAD
jgi:hypothetical protein